MTDPSLLKVSTGNIIHIIKEWLTYQFIVIQNKKYSQQQNSVTHLVVGSSGKQINSKVLVVSLKYPARTKTLLNHI